MPRVYASNNDPVDFCQKCFPKTEEEAFTKLGNLGDGPDSRGNCFAYDAGHPGYDNDEYRCSVCRKLLTEKDDCPRKLNRL